MRLRQDSIGSLLLLHTVDRELKADDLLLAQALADAATIGLLHARTISQQEAVNTQLHTALHSRIIIEQAKGVLAARRRIPLNQAFDAMRRHARQPHPARPGRPGRHQRGPAARCPARRPARRTRRTGAPPRALL
ncbi:ANTAR domain-containing protein [Streptomyces sp. NPDC087300]|uniref:ANTAR domain-containing protein n=1 Tax=Streptomyces sp. NPDC087300 TaxID=3365780 RepID=UPI003805B4DF